MFHIGHLLLGLVALVCFQLALSGNLLNQRIPAAQIEPLPFPVHFLLYLNLIFRIVIVDDLGELGILELIVAVVEPKSRVCQIHARRCQKLCLVVYLSFPVVFFVRFSGSSYNIKVLERIPQNIKVLVKLSLYALEPSSTV